MLITDTTKISRAPNLAQQLFEERMLIVTPRDSLLHRLNEVGTALWQILENPGTCAALCEKISERFDGFDSKQNKEEILCFIEIMHKKGLVAIE